MKTFFHQLSKTTKLILFVPNTPLLSSPIHTINTVYPMKTKNFFSQRILMLLCLMMVSMWGWGQTNQSTITISTSNTSGGSFSGTAPNRVFNPTASTANLKASDLVTELLTNNVTINTAFVGGTSNGDVTFSTPVTAASSSTTQRTFTINAGGSIVVSNAINLTSLAPNPNNTGVPGTNVSFTSGTNTSINADITTSGNGKGTTANGSAGNITITSSTGITLKANLTALKYSNGNDGDFIFSNVSTIVTTGGNTNDGQTAGIISGGTLTKSGTGTFVMAVANTYTGLTTVSAGVLNIQNATGTGTAAGGVTVSAGAALQLQGGITVGAEALSLNGTGISNDGALRSVGTGNLTNTWGGTITLASTAVRINADASSTLSIGTITGSGNNLFLGGIGNINATGTITTGTGSMTDDGPGNVTFSGTNTYTGATTITAGITSLGASNVFATNSNLVLNGGTFKTGTATGFSDTMGTLTLSASSTFALGGTAHTMTFSGSSLVTWAGSFLTINGWTGTAGSSGTAGKIIVGTTSSGLTSAQLAKFSFTGYGTGGVQLSTGEVVPKIPVPLVTSATTVSSTYGTASSYTITGSNTPTSYSATGLPTGMTVNTATGVITVAATTVAGTYSITVSAINGGGAGSATLSYTVNTKVLTISGLTGSNKVYDGTTAATVTGTAAVSGLVISETVTLGGTPIYAFAIANVGTATSISTTGYTISGNAAANYTLTQPTLSANITVATPTIVVTVGTYTYSAIPQGPNVATNTGTGTSYTFSYVGTGGTTYAASSILPTNAGSYTATATVAANGNFASASSSATAFTITKANPTATLAVNNSPATYSGAAQSATVSISASSVPGTVTTISTGGSATQTNTGTYAVSASFVPTDSANYNTLTNVSSGNFVISPAALLITANNASKCVGATYNLGTTAFTSSGLRSPDTIGSVTLTSSGSGSGASSGSYSIVPSAATGGTFLVSNYSITYSNGDLTVNPTNTAGTASSTPTLCINTALTTISHTTTAATGIGAATGLPAGVAATFASNTLTISGTPTASGTFNYSIPLTGGCGSVNATGTITVSPASAGGTVAGSATVCNGTNSATLIVSGQIGTIIRWESSLDNFVTAGTSIANATNTLTTSNLTATTYYRAVVTSGVCASAYSTVATVTVNSCINKWKGSVSTDWNTPGNWTLNLVPAVDANLIFDDSPANDCYLDQDRSVTTITNAQGVYGIVLNGHKLTLKGNLLFSGGATIDAAATNSTMQFSGLAVQSILTGVFKNATVYNLDINNSNNVVLSGNLRLLNHLTTTTGLLDAFTNSPTITYAGISLQTIEGNQFLGGKIDNLTVDNGIGVNLNTNFTITNTLVINTGKKLSVSSLYQLTALGTISNNGGTSGLILKSNAIGTASLIHNTNNVPATVERYISGPTEGWHFLSAPVSNQGISGSWLPAGSYGTGNPATGTGFDLYVWDEPSFSFKYKLDTTLIGWNSVHSGSNFSAGRGYLYSVQETNPTKEFIGNLNNGAVNYPITVTETLDPKLLDLKGFNLVGNPYPSSVDWQAASGWDRTNLEVSSGGCDMWVWNPTANNYGVFNSASGVGTNSISRYLAPMQGYFVKAAKNGNLAFDNSVRAHTGAGNWFKNTGIKNTGIKNPLIRIAVESEEGNGADEALLQFGYSDSNQGTSKLFSHVSSAPSLYLSLEDKKYSVRYLTTTAENNAVSIEFKAGKEGVYKLLFNFDSNEFNFIQLEDRLLKTATSLEPASAYLFKSSKEDSVSRFVLHFTAAENTTKKELNGLVYMDGSQLAIDLKGINGPTEIKLFDISGQLIVQKYLEGNVLTKLDLNLATQILLVHLTNAKGASSTKVFFSPLKQ